jgi:hypothetical protein
MEKRRRRVVTGLILAVCSVTLNSQSTHTSKYSDINGSALMQDVEDLAAIAERSAARNQYWGRIAGTEADHQTEEWIQAQFTHSHLEQVRIQNFPLPPQWMPAAWNLSAIGGQQSLDLRSAQPVAQSPGLPEEISVAAVYVGLGSALEFAGRDVKGKAVLVSTYPVGSVLRHSAASLDAMDRAAQAGAVAVVLIMELPGNVRSQLEGAGRPAPHIPTFSLGARDGEQLLGLMANTTVRLKIKLSVSRRPNLSTGSVWGLLPGNDRNEILVVAHHDSYFAGADDNATGVATLLAIVRHFAMQAQSARTHTIVFVATPAHHSGMFGVNWLRDNFDFTNVKLIINCEHTASLQTYVMPIIQKMNGPLAGSTLMRSNVTAPRMWYIGGDANLHDRIKETLRQYGVGIFDEPEPVALGELSALSQKAPSFQLVEAPYFYHTEMDRPGMISRSGLEAVARAYAAIIDGTE